MNDHTVPPTRKGFSRILILLIALVVAGGAGLAVVLGVQDGGSGKQTNTVTNTRTNTSLNANSFANSNSVVNGSNANQSGTEGWEVYRNERYRFSVEYPPSWKVNDAHRYCEAHAPADSCTNLLVSFPMARSAPLPDDVRVPEPSFGISYLGDNTENLPLNTWQKETWGWVAWNTAEINGVPVVTSGKLSAEEYQNDLAVNFTLQGKVFTAEWYDGGYPDPTNFDNAVKVLQSLVLP